ncbi:MAG: hypothetical protein EU536_01735 [Promethearchaeota archaeon]|nr:MAG: hypothetical protein EU536_01735 [Candidatus Lokiarchaeota archaeon]
MTFRRNKSLALLLLLIVVALLPKSSSSFTTTPQITDAAGDGTPPADVDMRFIWIDNNATHLLSKVELTAPFNQTLDGQAIYLAVSVNPASGSDLGWFAGWKADYLLGLFTNGSHIQMIFYDYSNVSNWLPDNNHLGYWLHTNNNLTVEFGYPLKTDQDGKGYLNLDLGQTVEIRFYSGSDSDFAPENGAPAFSYQLKPVPRSDISGFSLYLLTGTLLALISFHLLRKKRPSC